MNWNQIRQALKGPRNWQTAPSEFVRALKELMSSPSNSRRTGTAASGQIELLEIRQVLSAANPTATLNLNALTDLADLNLAASSVGGELQPHENTSDDDQDNINGQLNFSNSGSPVVPPNDPSLEDWFQQDFLTRAIQANSNHLATLSNLGFSNSSPSGRIENSLQSVAIKPSVNPANQLTNTNSGETVANIDDASLIDTVFEDSGSILDDTLSNKSPIGSNKSTDELPSHPTPALTPQNFNTPPTVTSPSQKPSTVEADLRFAAGQDAASNSVASDIQRHSHYQQWSALAIVRDFVARSMKGPKPSGLRLITQFHAEHFDPASTETNLTGREVSQSATGQSLRSVRRHFEEIYSSLDLFNSPLASSDVADTVSQFTLSFIADGTLPFEVPQFTPDTTTPNSVQYLPNTSALRVKQLREGLRHQHHSADVSTDSIQHDGTPEFVESENIPRQLKHVVLPRGPPRRQPDTVLRIMDSDAEAHVLQRLRYSIAPRGPSTVTVEMQSPEERSFSGPRVSPEETCRVQLAC